MHSACLYTPTLPIERNTNTCVSSKSAINFSLSVHAVVVVFGYPPGRAAGSKQHARAHTHALQQPGGFISQLVSTYMTSSEDLDAEAAKRGHAGHQNRLALVEDLGRPSKTAVSVF